MKYLSNSLPADDLKRIYRQFAKLLHPDAQGGSEVEFKVLQAEYETCQNSTFTASNFNVDNETYIPLYKNYTMPFGKHKGQKIKDLPVEYCQWLLANVKDLSWLLKDALKWRVENSKI